MVKLNDFIIPLVIGAVLSVVLSKKKTSFELPVVDPYYTNIDNAQAAAIQKLDTNIETLQSVKESNLGIAQSILDLERSTADVKISQIQTELDKTQGYIGSQQKIGASAGFASLAPKGEWQKQAGALLRKFSTAQAGGSLFPDFKLIANQENYGIVQQQAQYEIAQGNIAKASEMVQRQQGEIDRLNEEYQTRFGSLSRYG